MQTDRDRIAALGERLRAYRLGTGLSPETLADRIGVSRAAMYRYESGQPIRVDKLARIAEVLGVSMATLLGAGSEYTSSPVTFFSRMQQLEEQADEITVLFGPVSYLLTTDGFDRLLPRVMAESIPAEAPSRTRSVQEIGTIMELLARRKEVWRRRRMAVRSIVSVAEIEQFLHYGFAGRADLGHGARETRRKVARDEVESILAMIEAPASGISVGVIEDSMPVGSFQLMRYGRTRVLVQSPFRLGTFANIRIGVAQLSAAEEAVRLHEEVIRNLWDNALKGAWAAARLRRVLSG
ncbi:helix-turn-helix domain-containing protein [Paracoccus sediminicola]|uniref:helix-turn-helix domain-containing protein n=1 Tax=Paracoccus sediminicola TaxID=3017783 RepID=UPI0022F08CD8|nr:helix-turn-helix transcriptional regulator [Paracoccus sediminicola]WBU56115.1 helix-turn-helix transcriptional regulator [Paracoccus sediminicola]